MLTLLQCFFPPIRHTPLPALLSQFPENVAVPHNLDLRRHAVPFPKGSRDGRDAQAKLYAGSLALVIFSIRSLTHLFIHQTLPVGQPTPWC